MNAKKNNLARKLAGLLAESWIMKAAKNVHERNADNWNLPVNEKILANMYCILRDYGNGQFPPVYTDRQAVYESESKYIRNEVVDPRQEFDATMRMPFELYVGNTNPGKLRNLVRLLAIVDRLKLEKGANVLEVGCGGGWLSEILCIKGFNVTATTLSQSDIELANLRSESLKVKKIDTTMRCIQSPMESVDKAVEDYGPYQMVVCHGALHHAFNWKESISAFKACLARNGYLILCSEPSWQHTLICYRSSTMVGRHEIGFNGKELLRYIRKEGFRILKIKRTLMDTSFPYWIVAKLVSA